MTTLDDIPRIDEAISLGLQRGLVEPGQAQRVRLVARLGTTIDVVEGWTKPVSGMALARDLGISRAAVHKHVTKLRNLGFLVQAVTGNGYRLEAPFADLLVGEAVLPMLLGAPERVDGIAAADAADFGFWPGACGCLREGKFLAGVPYFFEDRAESTNLHLKAGAPRGLSDGALAVTDRQVGGRGRLGRRWVSEPGKDLTFSVLLRPRLLPAQAQLLSLAAAVAVAETLEALPGVQSKQPGAALVAAPEARWGASAAKAGGGAAWPTASGAGPKVMVKWPNDVLLGGGKVCGILLEGSMDSDRLQWAIAGMGLNVNGSPRRALEACGEDCSGRPAPVSLHEYLGKDVPRGWLLARLLERLTVRWNELETGHPTPGCAGLMSALRERDALVGSSVIVRSGLRGGDVVASGVAAGIGPEGQLLVREQSGEQKAVFAGEVTLASAS